MKFGLVIFFNTDNIGDDIQSYAMERFLPHVDYLIDREHLDSFYTETGEQVAAILGGWYLHTPLNWPPSSFLKLLPISVHISANSSGGGDLFWQIMVANILKNFHRLAVATKAHWICLKTLD